MILPLIIAVAYLFVGWCVVGIALRIAPDDVEDIEIATLLLWWLYLLWVVLSRGHMHDFAVKRYRIFKHWLLKPWRKK